MSLAEFFLVTNRKLVNSLGNASLLTKQVKFYKTNATNSRLIYYKIKL